MNLSLLPLKNFVIRKKELISLIFIALIILILSLFSVRFLYHTILLPREITEQDLKEKELKVNMRLYREVMDKVEASDQFQSSGINGLNNPFYQK